MSRMLMATHACVAWMPVMKPWEDPVLQQIGNKWEQGVGATKWLKPSSMWAKAREISTRRKWNL